MKNLRKVFAVVLVICMAFSLMAVASAAKLSDYSDASSVTQKEAVDVLTRAGVLAGTGGAFNPTGTFTREQAAKVICYLMVGPTAAGVLTTATSSFSDVAATRWSAPFIEYCASKGVINGVGDGKFVPEAPVTGTAFAKMLLVALGYGKNGEYTGANWEINALTDALSLGILTGTANFSAAATREQVAQYALNTLGIDYVAWSKDSESYIDKPAPAVDMATNIFFGLAKEYSTANGVYGYTWKNMFGTAMSDFVAAETVLAKVYNGTDVSALVNPLASTYKASLDTTVKFFYNGAEVTATTDTGAGVLYVANKTLYVGDGTGAADSEYNTVVGSIVNLIDTNFNGKVDKVSIVVKAVDYVTAAVATRVNLGVNEVSIPGVTAGYVDARFVTYPAGLAKDDVVLTVTIDGVLQVEKAKVTATAGAYTSVSAYGVYSVGGVAFMNTGLSGLTSLAGMTLGTSYLIYTDNDGGYAVSFGTVPAAAAMYAVVLDSAAIPALGQPTVYQAQILKADGTVAIVTTSADWNAYETLLVSYTVNTAGAYVYGATATAAGDGNVTNKSFDFIGVDNAVATTTTVFLVRYGAGTATSPYTYTAYTGYNAVPTLTDTSIQYFATNAKASIVYVDTGTPGSSTSNVYLLSTTYGTAVVAGTTYREYAAIVNGVVGTVKTIVDGTTDGFASFFADGVGYYEGITIPGSGIIGSGQAANFAPAETETAADAVAAPFGDGIIKIGANTYTYSDSTKFLVIENYGGLAPQTVTESTAAAIAIGDNVNFALVPGSTTALAYVYLWIA